MTAPRLPHGCGSWIIVRKSDGVAVLETFSERVASSVNPEKAEAVPAMTYLQNLNARIKQVGQ